MKTASAMGRELEHEPPQSIMDSVLRIGRGPSRLKQLRNFIMASLTFDSFSNLAPAGVRRTEDLSRQLTFEAGEVEIGLSVRRAPDDTLTITGQVLNKSGKPVEAPEVRVELVAEGDHVATSPLSPWGEFVFSNLPQDQYSLQVSFPDRELRTEIPV